MSTATLTATTSAVRPAARVSARAEALASRLERGAAALVAFARTLSDAEWQQRLPKDGRKVGVVVHHVAFVYPIEIDLAKTLAKGEPITGLSHAVIAELNAGHAKDRDAITRDEAIGDLEANAAAAAAAIRAFSDAELDRAATVSLYADAPLTCQFLLEDHAVRHSYHHLAGIRAAVGR